MTALTTVTAAQTIRDDGFVILHDVVPRDTIDRLVSAVDATMERDRIPFGSNTFIGHRTRRIHNLLRRDPVFADVPLHAPVLELAEAVLGRDLLLSSLTAIDIHPGETAQPLHADDAALPVTRPHDPLAVVAIWALTDFDDVNGGTLVAPGTHRAAELPRRGSTIEVASTTMRAGSVLVYDGAMWHGGGPNTSDSRRMGIVCNYYAGWLRQEESQLLGLTRDQVASFPGRLRRLVGYGTYRGLHGHVEGTDPATWFDPAAGEPMVWERIR